MENNLILIKSAVASGGKQHPLSTAATAGGKPYPLLFGKTKSSTY